MEVHLNIPFKYIFGILAVLYFLLCKNVTFFKKVSTCEWLAVEINSEICVEGKCHKQESVHASSFGKGNNREVELQWVSRHENFAHLCSILQDIGT